VAAKRTSVSPAPAAGDARGQTTAELSDTADNLGQDEEQSTEATATKEQIPCESTTRDLVPALIRLGAISGVGGILAYEVMAKLGPPIIDHGLAIDEPIFHWVQRHQVDWWAAAMSRFNKIGNTWTTWGAVGSAAVCLGFTWRRQRWLPPSAFATAILVDYCATHKLHRTLKRLGPPTSPLGTYPSGGTDRVVLFYGLIAYLLWRGVSGTPRGRIWAIGGVSALSFITGYCRQYLNEHWFIDIVCGLLYGTMLLVPIVIAVQLITDQAELNGGQRRALSAVPHSAI
jgi:membrane-associated phospholipid phosphatase